MDKDKDKLRKVFSEVASDGKGGIDEKRLERWLIEHSDRCVEGLRLRHEVNELGEHIFWIEQVH